MTTVNESMTEVCCACNCVWSEPLLIDYFQTMNRTNKSINFDFSYIAIDFTTLMASAYLVNVQ